jgi:hypothetical protein
MHSAFSGNTSVAAVLDGPVAGYEPCCPAASLLTLSASCFLEPPPRPPEPPLPPEPPPRPPDPPQPPPGPLPDPTRPPPPPPVRLEGIKRGADCLRTSDSKWTIFSGRMPVVQSQALLTNGVSL